MHARGLGRARHEFRFGGRELVVLGAVLCLIVSLVFAVVLIASAALTAWTVFRRNRPVPAEIDETARPAP